MLGYEGLAGLLPTCYHNMLRLGLQTYGARHLAQLNSMITTAMFDTSMRDQLNPGYQASFRCKAGAAAVDGRLARSPGARRKAPPKPLLTPCCPSAAAAAHCCCCGANAAAAARLLPLLLPLRELHLQEGGQVAALVRLLGSDLHCRVLRPSCSKARQGARSQRAQQQLTKMPACARTWTGWQHIRPLRAAAKQHIHVRTMAHSTKRCRLHLVK
jgi:hypothetical protein